MKMIKSYRADSTGRQNAEAILIRNTPENILLNSKKEHIQPCDIKEKYEKVNGTWEEKKLEKRTKVEKEILRSKIKESLKKNPTDAINDTSNNTKETIPNYSNPEKDLDIKTKKIKLINNENLFTTISTEQCPVYDVSRILPKENNLRSPVNLFPNSIELTKSPKASGNTNNSDSIPLSLYFACVVICIYPIYMAFMHVCMYAVNK